MGALTLRPRTSNDWCSWALREHLRAGSHSTQPRTDSEVIVPAAMAGGNTGLVLCQVGGQCSGQCPQALS